MKRNNPFKLFFTLSAVLIVILTIASRLLFKNWIAGYLISITLVTFAFYGFDKHQSTRNRLRIPEVILHILALIGGTIGAILGQLTFRHKTQKSSFRIIFYLIITLQIILAVLYLKR